MYVEGPDALKVLSLLGVNSFKNFGPKQGQAVRRLQLRRLRDRRRHPLPPRREPIQSGRAAVGAQLGPVSLRDRQVRRPDRTGRAHSGQTRSDRAEGLPLSGPGTERASRHREGHRQNGSRREVLQHDGFPIAGTTSPRVASRDGRSAGLRVVWTVGRRRTGQGRDRRGRAGVRPPAVRRPDVFEQHARVGVDPVSAAGDLYGRSDETVPAMAAGQYATKPLHRSAAASIPTTSATTT